MSRLEQYARELLNLTMSDYSEEYYCAGWLSGLEYELWAFVMDEDTAYWSRWLDESDRTKLLELANDAGGWYYWSDESPVGDKFIAMDDWLKMYEEHKNGVR
jgi:hypothetical protein